MSKNKKTEWLDGNVKAIMKLELADGGGKVKVFVRVATRYLEEYPELAIHHEIYDGERWNITVVHCGYKVARVTTLDHARYAIKRLVEAAKEAGFEWSKVTEQGVALMNHDKRKIVVEALHDIKYYSKGQAI